MSSTTNNNDPKKLRQSTTTLQISSPTIEEIETVLWLFPKEQGWNPGIEGYGGKGGGYAQVIPREHLLVGKIDGTIVACIACPRFGKCGWIGLYIVRDEKLRGMGFGIQMWKAAMEGPLKGCETIGLDGVLAQQANYRKSGFIHTPWNIIRHSATIKEILTSSKLNTTTTSSTSSNIILHPFIAGKSETMLNDCISYDQQIFPDVDRSDFLRKWLQLEKSFAVMAVKKSDGDDKSSPSTNGFGLVRPALNGTYRVGPLYASDESTAASILNELVRHVAKETNSDETMIFVDMPERHRVFAGTLSLQPGFSCGRMYWGKPMREMIEREFGIVCWEMTF
jgi:hypothetical protein